MQKITPFLWFDNNAEEAVRYYTSVFKNSRIGTIARYGDEGPGPKGSVMTATFFLNGQEFTALNGGPMFAFSQAISFMVHCDTQEEVDVLWEKLSDGGEIQQCGWLIDKFGITWQIIPIRLFELMNDPDAEKAGRVTRAMLQMSKIDVAVLERAYLQG